MVDHHKKHGDDPNSHINCPDPVQPGEHLEAFCTFSTVSSNSRRIYLLHLIGLNPPIIALIENLGLITVEKRLEQARQSLSHLVESAVDHELGFSEAVPGTERDMPTNLVRRMIELVPSEYLEIYRLYKKNGSLESVATGAGISVEEVEHRIALTRSIFCERMNLAILRLLDIDVDSPAPFDKMADLFARVRIIRQEVSATDEPDSTDDEPVWQLSEEERLEADDAFFDIDAAEREVFETDAVHMSVDEIAGLLEIEPDEVKKRLKKARHYFSHRIERLLAAWLLHKKDRSKAPRITKKRAIAARTVYAAIPNDCRKPFALFVATGDSVNEIAEKLILPEDEVQRQIALARKCIRSRALTAAVLAARKGEDIPTARDRIVRRLGHIVSIRKGRREEQDLGTILNLKPLVRLTDGERREVELFFQELDPVQRGVYVLRKGLEQERDETADYLDISDAEVSVHLLACQDLFVRRLTQLISVMLRKEAFVPDTPDMPESAAETARIAFRFIGPKNQEFFRENLISGDSIPEIADRLGVTTERVDELIDDVRTMLVLRADILVASWLREEVDGRMRVETILRDMAEREDDSFGPDDEPKSLDEYDSFINAELIEARKTLMLLDYDCREAFIFGLGAGLGAEKVAEYQNVSVEEVNRRILDAREMIRSRMEQLLTGMLRIRSGQTNAPRMKETEFLTAKAMFRFVPKDCRKAYTRYRVHGETVEEIALKLRLPIGQVKDQLIRAEQAVLNRTFIIAVVAAGEVVDGRLVAEEMLGDPKKIRFPADVWNKDAVVTEKSVVETARVVDVPSPEAEQKKKKHRNPIAATLAFLGALPTQLGAAKPTTEAITLGGLWAAIPTMGSLFLGPFLWVVWMLVTEFVYGFILVRTAPTLQARKKLVEQWFYLYSTSFILPFALAIVSWVLYECFELQINRWGAFFVYLVCNITLFIRAINQCSRWYKQDHSLCEHENRSMQLNTILNRGFAFEALGILLFFALLGQDILFHRLGDPNARGFVLVFILVAAFVSIVHTIAYLTFRYFYRMSKDEVAFEKHKPRSSSEKSFWISRGFLEFIRFVPFAMWVSLGNLTHIFVARLHVVGSLFELTAYSTGWVIVWWFNSKLLKSDDTRYDAFRWLAILVMFSVQYVIHRLLRFYIYY